MELWAGIGACPKQRKQLGLYEQWKVIGVAESRVRVGPDGGGKVS